MIHALENIQNELKQNPLYLYKLTLSHFENRRDVNTYFTKGTTETCALLSVRGKMHARLQKKAQWKCWHACRDAL